MPWKRLSPYLSIGSVVLATLLVAQCKVDKLIGPPNGGVLTLNPLSLADSAPLGSTAARPQRLIVGNGATGRITWTASTARNSAWLHLGAATGTAPDTLPLTLVPTGLALGTYRDTVVVTGSGSTEGALRIPVQFTVQPCAITPVTVGAQVTGTLGAASCGAPHRSNHPATLYSFNGSAGDSVSLELTAPAGYLVFDSTTTLSQPSYSESGSCAGVGGNPCLYYQRLPRTGSYLVEVTTNTAADSGAFTLTLSPPRTPPAPTTLIQLHSDSATVVNTGDTVSQNALVFRGIVSDPDRPDSLRLEVEAKPTSVAFTGTGTTLGAPVKNGQPALVRIGGLADDSSYHWRARSVDQTGRVGPWLSYGGNAETAADFVLGNSLAQPSSLKQLKSDGITNLAVGATNVTRTLIFSGIVTDPVQSEPVRLEVEYEPVGTAFTNVATTASTQAAPGSTVQATSTALTDNVDYHWQAREVSQSGRTSGWVSFGGNAESAADFKEALTPQQLVFIASPAVDTAGAPIHPTIQVAARDSLGNTLASFHDSIAIVIDSNPGGATLTPANATKVPAVAGVATFPGLSLDKTGVGYRLRATLTSPALTVQSGLFNVTSGSISSSLSTVAAAPATIHASKGDSVATITVTVKDPLGNPVPNVTVTLADTATGDSLRQPATQTNSSGVATGSVSARVAGVKTITAAAGGQAITQVATVTVLPAHAQNLTFTTQPTSTSAGATITPAVQVTARDSLGNVDTSYSANVTVAIGTNPGGATLGGTTTVAAAHGVASFADLTLDKAGTGYTLTAAGVGVAVGATSASFNIGAGTGTKLAFTVEPSAVVAGAAITPAIEVTAQDASGNTVSSFTGTVTLSLGANPGSDTLGGTISIAAVGGKATFSNVVLHHVGAGYTLTAGTTGFTGATSTSFSVRPGSATQLAFTTQPTGASAGSTLPATVVTAQDAFGNTDTTYGASIVVAIDSNPGGGTLGGTDTVAATHGISTFSTLTIDKAGVGYRLAATATGLTRARSNPFNITAGAVSATLSTVIALPGTITAGGTGSTISVTARDSHGNPIAGAAVVLASTGTGNTLVQPAAVTDSTGLATGSITSTKAETKTISATVGGVLVNQTAAVVVDPGAVSATQSTLGASPTSIAAGGGSSVITATAHDAFGNPIPGQTVVLAATGAGNTVTQPPAPTDASGIATGALSSTVAASKVVSATIGGVALTQTDTVAVTSGGATHLVFSVEPSNTTAGAGIAPTVRVSALDANNNVSTGFTGSVTLAIGTNPGGGVLLGTTSVPAVAGVASFPGIRIDPAGTGYTLAATASGLAGASSTTFNILTGAAGRLGITTQPSATAVNGTPFAQQPVLQVQDSVGNPVSQSGTTVTAAVGTGAGVLGGTLSALTNAGGQASFTDLKITGLVGSRTLTFSTTGLNAASSNAVVVSAGPATQIAVSGGNHQSATAGTAVGTPPSVLVTDQSGNPVSGIGVTFALPGSAGANGSLTGPNPSTNASGIATVGSWTLGTTAKPDSMTATSTGLTGSPLTFVDTAKVGAAANIAKFSGDNLTGQVGKTLATPHDVLVTDANGNGVPNVTVAWAAQSGGSVSPTTNQTDATGHAQATRTLGTSAGPETTTATATLNGTPTTVTFNVSATVGGPTQMKLNGGDLQKDTVGVTLPTSLSVLVQDSLNNPVPGVTISWAVINGGGSVSAPSSVTNASGIASISWTLGTAMSPVDSTQLVQATGVASPVTFTAFTVPGAVSAAQTSVTATSPISASSGSSQSTITVTARDQYGNVIKGKTVTLASTGGGNTLTNPAAATNVNGVATGTLSSTVAEGKTVAATVGGVPITQQGSVVVNPAAAASLAFAQQPTNVVAGASITPAITVEVLDAFSNLVTAASNPVSLTLASNPGSATLSGSVTNIAAVNGVATFANASLNKIGTGYTLSASSTGLAGQTSSGFNVTSGAVSAAQSTVTATSPITAGGAASTVTVTARDGNGNPIPGATVVLAATGTGNTLTQPVGVTDASGVATGSLASTVAETKTVSAKINGVDITQAPTVVVNPGAAQNIGLNGGGGQSAAVGTAVTIPPSVIVKDLNNNPVSGVAVTFAVTGGGGVVAPTTAVLTNASGVAQVTSWTLGNTAGTNTLSATATGLSGSPVSITATGTPGNADHFAFSKQPTNTVAGAAITPTVSVAALDVFGNVATSFAGNITLSIANNAGGGALSGTTTVPATGGVANFPGISIDKAGTGYTLTASNSGPTPATSAAFNITPGAATSLVFSQQPTNTLSQTAIAPAVTVTALDGSGNVATGFANPVSLSIANNAGGGTLTGGGAQTPTAGVATFSALSIDKVGTSYTLSASATGVTGATSSAFNITPGAATKLAFTVQPSSSTAGASIAPAVQLTAQDAAGNTATGFNGSVSVAIGNNPGGATLQGTTGITATAGMANFSDLSLTKVGAGYTLTATATGLTGATSTSFDITPATAAALVFTTQPASDTSGGSLGTIQVTARDAFGNTATGFANQVTLAIANNAGGGTLSGTAGVTPVGGVASFPGLSIDKAGTGYTLSAAASGVTGTTSSGFNVTAGTATHVVFTGQPSNAVAGAAIAPAVQVTALDANGNVAATAGTDTIRIGTNPGGAVLSGDTAVARVAGASSHVGLTLNKAGIGYTLTARSNALTGATSSLFNVTAGTVSAAQTTVSASSPITAGGTGSTVTVTARDALGNPVAGATVVLAVTGTNNTITQPAGVTDAGGVATGSFTSTVAESKTVSATVNGVAITQTATVVVNPGTPVLSVNAGNNQTDSAGGTLPTPPSVIVKDALNNPVSGVAVTFAATASNGTVTGGSQTTGANGIATVGSWTLGNTAKADTLTATSTAGSATFIATATAGNAAIIAAADTLPASATVGTSVTAPSVRVTDSHGNPVSGVSVTFTLTAGNGTISPTSPATLPTDAAGHAALTSWTLGTTAGANTVSVSGTGLTGSPVIFTVTGTAGAVSPTLSTVAATTPITASSGASQSTITVTAKDASGNPITGATVVLAATGSGNALTQPAVTNASGIATGSLSSTVAESKTVSAKINGVGITQTATVVVNPAAASKLVFTGQPVSDTAGGSLGAIQVTAQDQFSNVTPAFTGTDTVSIGTNPSGGTLAGTVAVAAVAGVANFPGLSINKVGTGYTLTVRSGTLTAGTSSSFNVTAGTAAILTFTTQPTTSTAGTKITPTVSVTAQDARGNTVTSFTGTISLSLTGGTAGAHLRGTASLAATAGVASFPTISVDSAGAAYTMVAAATGVTSGTSAAFNVRPGSATQLAFRVQPTSVAAGAAITPAVVVSARDSLGNRDTTYTGSVTVAIGTNPGGGTLTGGSAKAAVAGLDTFPALTITKTGTGYTLTAAASALTGATSSAFTVSPGSVSAAQSTVTASTPITASTGASQSTITVTAKDGNGNLISGATVVLAATGTGNTLTQPAATTNASGVATGTLSSTVAETKTVSATITGVGITQTASVVVNPGAPANLNYVVQPTNAASGASIAPAIQVEIRDALNNRVTTAANQVSLVIANNPAGGALSGTVTNVTPVSGVATFSNASIDKTGTGYTLSATATGLTGATSSAFNITPGAATHLVFTQGPSNAAAGAAIAPAITVTALDASNNVATGFANQISLAIGTNVNGGTLTGGGAISPVSGVATFSGVSIDKAGTGYTLTTSATGVTGATSAAFNITAGTVSATQTTVTATSPITAGGAGSTITVTARDGLGNPVAGATVVIAVSGTGNTFSQPAVTGGSGVTTTTLTSTVAETKTVSATVNSVAITQTAPVVVNPGSVSAAQSTLTVTSPITASSGSSQSTITVTAKDALGNPIAGATVILAATGTGNTLTQPVGTTSVSGVATGTLSSTVAETKTVSATINGTGVTQTGSVVVNPGSPANLNYVVQPTNTVSGASITPAIQVEIRDALNNRVTTATNQISLAFANNAGGGTLSGAVINVSPLGGVATFSNASIDKVGTAYTLSATATGLTGATSSPFNITAGTVSASQSTVTATSPITASSGSSLSTVTVTAKDAVGNPVAGVTVVIASSGTGNAIVQPLGTTNASGVATGTLSSTVAESKLVSATISSVAITQTATVVVSPAAASQLVFTGQPVSDTAAGSLGAIQVTARDQFGNTATGFTGTDTVTIVNNAGGGTLAGTATVAAAVGVANFPALSIDKTGTGYTLGVKSGPSLTTATSSAFNVTAGHATTIASASTPPASASVGTTVTPPSVLVTDSHGNPVSGVSVVFTVTAGNGSISPASPATILTDVAGHATLTTWTLGTTAGTNTVTAASTGLTGTPVTFSVNGTAGSVSASQSTVAATTPITASSGASQSTITVTAKDASGNPVANAAVSLTVGGTGNTVGSLTGTTNGSGVYTTTLSSTVAESKTVSATAGGIGITQTATVVVNPATASQLVFTGQPVSDTSAGSLGAVQVTAKDQFGNVATGFTGTDTVTIATNAGPGGTLSGTAIVAATAGVANFPGLSIDKTGTGYTLGVKSGAGVTTATSNAFNVTPGHASTIAAASTPPASATVGTSVTAPSVLVTDANGNPVSGVSVTFAVTAGNGSISPTTPIATDGTGHATLTTWTLGTTAGTNTVTATSAGLAGSPVSFTTTGTAGAATHLVFSQQPTNATAATSIAPAITVTALDASNNVATGFSNQISLAIGTNAGGGTLTGGAAVPPASGVATFSGVSIDKSGTGYTLTATATGVTGATSSTFNITPGSASALFFTAQPVSDTAAGSLGSIQVTARDAQGNTATGFGGPVALAIATNAGGGTLSGVTPVTAAAGVATFTGMSINKTGTGYTLAASSSGLTGATSATFNVTPGNASVLVFTSQPVSDTAAGSLGTIQVTARDAQGNTATQFGGSVSLAIGANPGGGTLSGTTPVTAASGIASFTGMSINKAGTAYTLTAASTGLTGATSSAFNITPGSVSASQSTVAATSPITASTGSSQSAITVTAKDANGNVIPSATVALGATGSNNTLSASGLTNSSGVYSGTLSSTTAESKTVSATINGVAITQTATVVVNAGAATQLVFTTQPSNTPALTNISPAVVVKAEDAFGNVDLNFAGSIGVAIQNDPNGGLSLLSGGGAQAPSAGVVTFANLQIDLAGTGFTLRASSGALSVISTTFNIQ